MSTATGNVLHGTTPHAVFGGVHLRSSKLRPGGLHELYDKEGADDIFKDCTYIVGGEPSQLSQLALVFRAQADAVTILNAFISIFVIHLKREQIWNLPLFSSHFGTYLNFSI